MKQPPVVNDAVSRLLANATPPRYSGELRGEQKALTVFRQAHLNPGTSRRRRSTSASKLLAVGITVVGLSGGGAALAAATGHLTPQASRHLTAQAGGHPAVQAGEQPVASATRPAAGDAAHSKGGPSSSPSPSPSLRGLCNAYTNSAGSNPGNALDNPAFTALASAAGGRDKISSYCATALKSPPSAGHASANDNAGASHNDNAGASSNSNSNNNGQSGSGQADPSAGNPTTPPTSPATGNPATGTSTPVSGVPSPAPTAPTAPATQTASPAPPTGQPSL